MLSKPPIVILTDFGYRDPYVGIMKGVIYQIAPTTQIIDLNHGVLPGDIQQAAVTLWQASPYFPPGTIYLVVVDPGVGTTRKAILAYNGQAYYIGPDNGVFSFVLGEKWSAYALENPKYWLSETSTTFHGRDIFAPSAAHLSIGTPPASFGSPIDNPLQLKSPCLEITSPKAITGEILFTDHFGNLLTSIGHLHAIDQFQFEFRSWLKSVSIPPSMSKIQIQSADLILSSGEHLPLVRTFAEIDRDKIAGIIGSRGLIEIVANRSRAENQLPTLAPGTIVRLEW